MYFSYSYLGHFWNDSFHVSVIIITAIFQDIMCGLEGHGDPEGPQCAQCQPFLSLVQMHQGTNSRFQWYVQ